MDKKIITITIREGVPEADVKSALRNYADGYGVLNTANAEGVTLLWSDNRWMAGTAEEVSLTAEVV